ncbi:tyrosine type site-specific recombinase [gut metagenome]|uniref:Tyrosine type site-specific recombinase n=1 Tax=gut metagenome TaxID=749906 RepID=J9GK06_9ZZZZ
MPTIKLAAPTSCVTKSGAVKIRIAVRHQQKTTYIQTPVLLDNISQFKNQMVVNHPRARELNKILRDMVYEYQERLYTIPDTSVYTCKQLADVFRRRHISGTAPTFNSVCDDYVDSLKAEGRQSYAELLERNGRYFSEFMKGDILLKDITPMTIDGYSRFLKIRKGLSGTTISMMMSRTKTIVNRGAKMQLVKYDVHPYMYYKIKQVPPREVDLTIENFRRIMKYHPKTNEKVVAHSLFMLSFYLCGINMGDLLEVDFRHKDSITFVRKKVANMMQGSRAVVLHIPEQARKIIGEFMNPCTGRLDFGYKFSYRNFYRFVTRALTKIQKELDLDQKLVYYSARKSFAQYASEIGIPDGVIDYCLGHSDHGRGVIRYYTKVKEQQAAVAVKRVIEYVEKPELYKEFVEMRNDIMLFAAR